MKKVTFRAMGCEISAIVESNHPQAIDALENVPGWFEEWEQILSRFRLDSELNWLNYHQGVPVPVSPILLEVIKLSLKVAYESNGLVTPTILNALKKVGYDRSFDNEFNLETMQPFSIENNITHWEDIQLDAVTMMVTIPAGVSLDLGGVAKGWAAHETMLRLKKFGPALVDAGGDISISEKMRNAEPWPIEVADPLHDDLPFGLLDVPCGGIATSGTDYRRWKRNGKWMHHIIDPRRGLPAQTDILCTTIVGPDVMSAEMAAKIVLILGSQEGLSWLEEHEEFSGLMTLEDGRRIITSNMMINLYERNETWK